MIYQENDMNVNFEYYRIFYYVAKYGNFTKAAHVLNSSQPNVTRAMNCLEHEINCTLFVRTNRGVFLTPEGERLYTRVSAAMVQLQMAEEELTDSIALEHGSISLGASEIALNIYLLDRLRKFHMTYPGVRLKICNDSTPQAIHSVRNGEIDFAVVTSPMNLDEPLKEIRLQGFQEILVGGKSFAGLADKKLTFEDLKEYPFICLGMDTTTYHFYYQLFLSYGVELVPDTEAATTDQVLPLVKSELGLAFLPEIMARDAIQKQEIVQIQLKHEIPMRYISMVYDEKRPMNVAAQRFKKILLEENNRESR